ncbi:MAG: hypothetical protein RJQ08_11770 [Salinisphaeraceae bacterium]
MKLSSLSAGQTVYEVVRRKMGNTSLSTVAVVPVRIEAVDEFTGFVRARWNDGPARSFQERQWKKWRLKRPVLVDCGSGRQRLATAAEKRSAGGSRRVWR